MRPRRAQPCAGGAWRPNRTGGPARRRDARRSRAGSPTRARRSSGAACRVSARSATRATGFPPGPTRPPRIHRNVRWRQGLLRGRARRGDDEAPDAPRGSKGTSARGAARSASPAAVSRACASRRRVRRTRSVPCARGRRRGVHCARVERRAVLRRGTGSRRGFGISVRGLESSHPRTETAGREALIEFSDAPGRLA